MTTVNSRKTLLIEIGNAISHGIGAILSIIGLIFLILKAVHTGSAIRVVTFSIYGAVLILFYLSSCLYHALIYTRARHVFRIFDHSMIFLVIAATYTPYCLVAIRGWLGWTIFGVIWGLAVLGVIHKSVHLRNHGKSKISTILYVLMGWLCMVAVFPLWNSLGPLGFSLLLAGGVTFTLGAVLYSFPTAYTHLIWHIFVLIGTALMYFSILLCC